MELAAEYALFLFKFVTVVVGLLVLGGTLLSSKPSRGEIKVTDVGETLKEYQAELHEHMLSDDEMKSHDKEQKRIAKKSASQPRKKQLYVLDFVGSVSAKEVESLREEITAILTVAKEGDEVLVKVDSGGGFVHTYGLGSSQLARIKDAGLKLTVSVDKIAASGGYMMACVADSIIAAPFAIVGSVGVISEFPNFNRLLKKMSVDVEQHTAGEYKRTLSMLGENNDSGREKFKDDLAKTHKLFQEHVTNHRPNLAGTEFATGETWYGTAAMTMGLIDTVKTSDDFIREAVIDFNVLQVRFERKKKLSERVATTSSMVAESLVLKLSQASNAAKY